MTLLIFFLCSSNIGKAGQRSLPATEALKVKLGLQKKSLVPSDETKMVNWDDAVKKAHRAQVLNKLKRKWGISKKDLMAIMSSNSQDEETIIPPTQPPQKKTKPAAAAGKSGDTATDAQPVKTPQKKTPGKKQKNLND